MPVTIMDIAKAAGKSYPTVSRALNDHPKISEKTKREIREVAARLGYRPSFAGTALKKGRTSTFAVIVPDLADPFYSQFISHFKKAASEKEFDVIIYDYERDRESERKYLEQMQSGFCDGAVAFITSFRHTHDLVEKLWNIRVPLVTVGTPHEFAENAQYDWISVDSKPAVRKILQCLKKQGKSHLVQLFEPMPDEIFTVLTQNLRKLLQKSGLPATMNDIIFTLPSASADQAQGGLEAGLELMIKRPEVDIIWARNGFQAYGLLLAAHQCGRRIPEDVAVFVSDNTWINQYSVFPLIGIDQRLDQLAGKALDFLFQRLTSTEWPDSQRFELESKPVFPDNF